jgi:hypothetical protein
MTSYNAVSIDGVEYRLASLTATQAAKLLKEGIIEPVPTYRVTSECVTVQVPIAGSKNYQVTLWRGGTVPAGVLQKEIDRLVSGGFIELVEASAPAKKGNQE